MTNIIKFPVERTAKYIQNELMSIIERFEKMDISFDVAMEKASEFIKSENQLDEFEDILFDVWAKPNWQRNPD